MNAVPAVVLAALLGWEAAVHSAPSETPTLRTLAVAAAPEGSVPAYAGRAAAGFRVGVEQRFRFESRRGLMRERSDANELSFGLSRSRLFLAIEPARRPLALAVELQDSRQFGGDLRATALSANELDILQLRAELDFDRWLGAPVRVQAGRRTFDAVDRRLLARNRFRNTTSAFDGITVGLGREKGRLTAEAFALRPVARRIENLDRPAEGEFLAGILARASSASTVLEPYYLYSRSDSGVERLLHTTGAHIFGRFASGTLDHDLHLALQAGSAGGVPHRAFALHAEIGRSFTIRPISRAALWLNYASGDRDPGDSRSNRFDPLFGASHAMYGFTGLFAWQNIVNPAAQLALRPSRTVRLDAFYRLYWLASSRDGLVRVELADPTGSSGSFVGQEVDLQLRWSIHRFTELEVQYGELFAGSFLDRTGAGKGARVLFVALVLGTGGAPAR